MGGLIGHIVDYSEKYPGKLGKILMRPKKKRFSVRTPHFSLVEESGKILHTNSEKYSRKLLTTCLLSTSEPSYGKYSTTTKLLLNIYNIAHFATKVRVFIMVVQ